MPETIAPSSATSLVLSGNSAGSAPSPTVGTKPLKCNGTLLFRGERRRALWAPRKSRGLLTHRHLRCNMTDPAGTAAIRPREALARGAPAGVAIPKLARIAAPLV